MATPPQEPTIEAKKFPDAPWLGQFWLLLQPFVRSAAEALNRKLTISENMAGAVVTVPIFVTASGAVQADAVALPTGLSPRLVWVGGAVGSDGAAVVAPTISWSASSTSLRVTAVSGLAVGARYTLTLAVLSG